MAGLKTLRVLMLVPLITLCGLARQPLERDEVIRPFPGAEIERRTLTEPRPNVIYIVKLDPKAVRFIHTPGNDQEPQETNLQTTRAFLEQHELNLAFNVAFYRSPRVGGLPTPYADLCGAAVAGGEVISQQEDRFPAIEITVDNQVRLLGPRYGLEGRHIVFAGSEILVRDGASVMRREDPIHPRTAFSVMEDGTFLVVVVDGRQPGRSEGLSMRELADLLVTEGAVLALNLDGGGSTTLAIRGEDGKGRVLNVPVGILDQPGSERPVGSNLGVRALAPPATQRAR